MALYVCLVLAAEFVALSEQADEEPLALAAIWGTTIGLILAHLFAFNLSEQMFGEVHFDQETRASIVLQLVAGVIVAAAVSLPIVVFGVSTGTEIAALAVALFIGLTAFGVARSRRRSGLRSALFGLGMLLVATAVVVVKAALAGH
jgi:hypothetical protein